MRATVFFIAGDATMPPYKIVALSEAIADRVRASRKSPGYGHPVHEEMATGYGPCRSCLRDFRIGVDRRLLFTLDPFHGLEPYPLPGPVFIHETECDRYPEYGGFPADLLSHDLTLSAYGRGRILRAEERTAGPGVEDLISRQLTLPDVDYLHVRDTTAGCYDFRIERG
jgi:hypothetical protein